MHLIASDCRPFTLLCEEVVDAVPHNRSPFPARKDELDPTPTGIHPRELTPRAVADFLLLNGAFPRSVLVCVRQTEFTLEQLRARYGLRGTREAAEGVEELRAGLEERDIDRIVDGGLHEFLDWVQRMLIAISGSIGTAFFRDWRPDATQSQEQ